MNFKQSIISKFLDHENVYGKKVFSKIWYFLDFMLDPPESDPYFLRGRSRIRIRITLIRIRTTGSNINCPQTICKSVLPAACINAMLSSTSYTSEATSTRVETATTSCGVPRTRRNYSFEYIQTSNSG